MGWGKDFLKILVNGFGGEGWNSLLGLSAIRFI
jgi:hypothetical protein